jgi:hypothetical protein
MRTTCLILSLLAFLFAGFQYNDPDPWIWIGLYGAAGVSLLMAGLGMPLRWLAWLTAIAGLVFVAKSTPGVWLYFTNNDGQSLANAMSKEYPYIEETREFGGAIIAMAMSFFAGWAGKRKSVDQSGGS